MKLDRYRSLQKSLGLLTPAGLNPRLIPGPLTAQHGGLSRPATRNAPPEQRVAVQRALGHLVVDLGEATLHKSTSGWTFIAAETLLGLSAIAPTR